MSEWLKEHAWKVCVRQRTEGSNPSLTAIKKKSLISGFFCDCEKGMRTATGSMRSFINFRRVSSSVSLKKVATPSATLMALSHPAGPIAAT